MKKILIAFIICIMCLCDAAYVVAAEDTGEIGGTAGQSPMEMETGSLMFITLAKDLSYRWNANDSGSKNSVIHLDDTDGENCDFRFDYIEGEWYGIKFIRDGGIDRFADIDDKSKKEGAVLHLWEDDDDKVKGNNHRQFAFEYQGQDENSNALYYIKNRNSDLYMGYEDTDENGKPSSGDKIIQTSNDKKELWIITKDVIPKSGKEINDLIKSDEEDAYALCQIFKKYTIQAINWKEDAAVNGNVIHLYELETSNK